MHLKITSWYEKGDTQSLLATRPTVAEKNNGVSHHTMELRHPVYTKRWYALVPSKKLNKKPVPVPFKDVDLVVWRNRDGLPVVMRDTCPHRGARLSMGKSRDGCLECPYHGWQFDENGKLVQIPAGDGAGMVGSVGMRTYAARECGPFVWFSVAPTSVLPPVTPEMFRQEWAGIEGEMTFDAPLRPTLENSIDVGHVNFVHTDFGDSQNGHVEITSLERETPDRIVMRSVVNHKSENMWVGLVAQQSRVDIQTELILPNTVIIKFTVRDVLKMVTYVTFTPLQDEKTKVCWSLLRSPRLGLADGLADRMFVQGMEKALAEDRLIVESLRAQNRRVDIPVDAIQQMFAHALLELNDDVA